MWLKTYTKTYENLTKKQIWHIWTDINNWPNWHTDLEYCQLKGDFKAGNSFILKPKKGPKVSIKLLEVKEEDSFTDCTQFPGAKMYDQHQIKETAKGIQISNRLWVTGPLKWLWIALVAKNVANSVPEEMEALVKESRKAL